nr:PWT6hEra [Pyricularia oryzae]
MQLSKIYLLALWATGATALFSEEENLHKIKNGEIPPDTKDYRGKPLFKLPGNAHCYLIRHAEFCDKIRTCVWVPPLGCRVKDY